MGEKFGGFKDEGSRANKRLENIMGKKNDTTSSLSEMDKKNLYQRASGSRDESVRSIVGEIDRLNVQRGLNNGPRDFNDDVREDQLYKRLNSALGA